MRTSPKPANELTQQTIQTEPRITVIITTYKRPKLLKRAIESVLRQTYPSFLLCVYDNASGDETANVVSKLQKTDSRIKYHCHPENIGMMNNYQHAFSHVTTPFFSFLSDDDVVLPNFLESALKGFAEHPDIMFSAGATVIVNEKKEVIINPLTLWKREGYYAPPEGAYEMINKWKWIPPTGILFNHSILKEVPICISNQRAWDCDFLLQIAARFPIFVSKKMHGIFLHHEQSFSAQQDSENWRSAVNKIQEGIKNNNAIPWSTSIRLLERLKRSLKEHAYSSIRHYVVWGKIDQASLALKVYTRHYTPSLQIILLTILIKMCARFPKSYCFVEQLKSIKRILKRMLLREIPKSAYKDILSHLVEVE